MPAGQKLAELKQFVRLIAIHPSGSGGVGTGGWQLAANDQLLKANLSDN